MDQARTLIAPSLQGKSNLFFLLINFHTFFYVDPLFFHLKKPTYLVIQKTGRAYFNLYHQPAFLQIDPLQITDAGDYRCRVDFKKARTINTVINLKIIGKIVLIINFCKKKKKKLYI